jgi:hypothetical protein
VVWEVGATATATATRARFMRVMMNDRQFATTIEPEPLLFLYVYSYIYNYLLTVALSFLPFIPHTALSICLVNLDIDVAEKDRATPATVIIAGTTTRTYTTDNEDDGDMSPLSDLDDSDASMASHNGEYWYHASLLFCGCRCWRGEKSGLLILCFLCFQLFIVVYCSVFYIEQECN